MQLNEVLNEFGLSNKEDDVYLACLELGQASVNEISIKANIKRTTAYDVLENLKQKGLVGQTVKKTKRLFFAEEPEKLHKILEEKRNKLIEIMPILKSLQNTVGDKPKIRYYEGRKGLEEVYKDTLCYTGELLAFVTDVVIVHLDKSFLDNYLKERIDKKLFARVIGPDSKEIIKYQKQDKNLYKETRLVPKEKFPFSIEMNIYGNKIAFVSFKEGMGVIIESNEISNNMRYLFELAWMGAK